MGAGGIYVWVNKKAAKRMAMIGEQLPDAVELMVRSLRVGHPFLSSIGIVAKEVADPLDSEMGVIADEATYGRDMGEALKAMAERIDLQDLRFLAVAEANTLPTEMTLATMMLTVPPLLIILLGPSVHGIITTLGGGGF